MNFYAWAARWGIPALAVADLIATFHAGAAPQIGDDEGASESNVQARVRLEAAEKNILLWRNNVGVAQTEDGRPVRYGLANDSKQLNTRIKSADLIGIRPVLIQPHHVGFVLGQFVSRECKKAGWSYQDTPREQAQLKWAGLVASMGGDAAFANDVGTL